MTEEKTTQDIGGLQDMLEQFLSEHEEELGALGAVQTMRHALLQQEARRLSARLGPAHPRVQRLERQIERSKELVGDIAVEREVASIQVPEVDKDDVLIQGAVYDEQGRGWAGLTVHVEDAKGNVVRSLETQTDASGYYAIKIDPAMAEELTKAGAHHLAVRTQKGVAIHREAAALELAKGSRAFVDVPLRRARMSPIRRKQPSKGEPEEQVWVVRGTVRDADGPVEGLMVSAFDRDRQYDDKLGAALTNAEGEFEITFRKQDFREGREPGPDLYLTIVDSKGNVLYSSEDAIRPDAGQLEEFDIVIEDRDLKGDREKPAME
jgi:hypothetical protein